MAAGASGAYDNYFVQLARHLVAAGMRNAILRLGWEFNERSYPWYAAGQAASFVRYWRNIVTAVRSVPDSTFAFEWNPDRGDQGGGDSTVGDLASYYPGNQYVDIVGLDVYDSSWQSYPGAAAEFQSIRTQAWGLDWLADFGQLVGRPLAIPELGLGSGPSSPDSGAVHGPEAVSGGDDPTFIVDMLRRGDEPPRRRDRILGRWHVWTAPRRPSPPRERITAILRGRPAGPSLMPHVGSALTPRRISGLIYQVSL